jgi:hypothetical protein
LRLANGRRHYAWRDVDAVPGGPQVSETIASIRRSIGLGAAVSGYQAQEMAIIAHDVAWDVAALIGNEACPGWRLLGMKLARGFCRQDRRSYFRTVCHGRRPWSSRKL